MTLAVLIVVTACGEKSSKSSQAKAKARALAQAKPFTRAELDWVRRFGAWDRQYRIDREDAEIAVNEILSGSTTMAEYRHTLRALRNCRRNLRSIVGAPTIPELRAVYEVLARGCARDARLASVPGPPGPDETDAFNEGKRLIEHGRAMLARRLLVNRVTLPRQGGRSTESRIEPRFSRAASALVKDDVEVRCWSVPDWRRVVPEYVVFTGYPESTSAGFASSGRANLNPGACKSLVALAYRRRPAANRDLADSVQLLAYTAERIAGPEQLSSQTQCYAMQDIRPLARSLGATRSLANRLTRTFWTDIYPTMDEYRSPACRNGDEFDKNPSSNRWP